LEVERTVLWTLKKDEAAAGRLDYGGLAWRDEGVVASRSSSGSAARWARVWRDELGSSSDEGGLLTGLFGHGSYVVIWTGYGYGGTR